jgi:hypothetical protein
MITTFVQEISPVSQQNLQERYDTNLFLMCTAMDVDKYSDSFA